MLDYSTWRELVAAFVAVEARRGGWEVVSVQRAASTRTLYVKLRHADGIKVRVRVSDHRARGRPATEYHVRRGVVERLSALPAWLAGWIPHGRAKKDLPSEGQQHASDRAAGVRPTSHVGSAERVEFPRSEGPA